MIEDEFVVLLAAVIVGIFVTFLLFWISMDKKLDIILEAINQLAKRERYNYVKTTEWIVQNQEEETER